MAKIMKDISWITRWAITSINFIPINRIKCYWVSITSIFAFIKNRVCNKGGLFLLFVSGPRPTLNLKKTWMKKKNCFHFFFAKPTDPNFYVRISRNNIFPRLVNKIRTSNNPSFVLDDRNNLRGMLVL